MRASNRIIRVFPLRLAAAPLVIFGVIAAFAQPVEPPVPKTKRIAEIEKLMEAGQLNMVDAIRMAEKHTKGKAFDAECLVRPGPFEQPVDKPVPGDDADEPRLEYHIACVVESQAVNVIVDGKAKKVTAPPAPPKPDPGPKPEPDPAPVGKPQTQQR